jgi:glucose/mannose-6-phosphate isomerase
MMDQLVKEFPQQLDKALEIGKNANLKKPENPIHNVFVAGMGGSGIGANFVAELIREECKIPYLIGKGYSAPAYIGKNTLVIASSYSGNTEETLETFQQILNSGAKIVVVSSGGKLIELAKENDLDYIQVPAGSPSPRACLGYSLVQQLFILNKLGLISEKIIHEVEAASELIKKEQEDIQFRAERIAPMLQNKIPVIYTTDRMEAVAVRFRQQINENGKSLCWHHVIPEMNHNELVGWRDEYNQLAVLYFRNKDDYPRNQVRMDINKEIIGNYTSSIIEVYSKGQSLAERMLYFVHLGDWISVYLAALKGIDAVEIKVIDYLKSELGKV